ncbi:hypothetical protein BLNAU_16833 [Blattamonas nauphoetae]|uniref:RRM domain-containing protein n=1 Tax=Blattamonas nauphoetae TaxID=2049346 RepID=A0ABQ9X951_9EUKA|nr:hypothetical protein BLNAU_16833 [Blattamonas nauphoetae]
MEAPNEQQTALYGVYLSNIPDYINQPMIRNAYSKYGEILEVSVVSKRSSPSENYAFVRYRKLESTFEVLDDKSPPVFTDPETQEETTLSASFADAKNCLFIAGIPTELNEAKAKAYLEEITSIKTQRFTLGTFPDGGSRGHGWATYSSHTIAVDALQLLGTTHATDVPLFGYFARRRAFDPRQLDSVKSLFIKGIAAPSDWQRLHNWIMDLIPLSARPCLKIVMIPTDVKTRQQMGHAYAHFRCKDAAEMALEKLDGAVFEGRRLKVEWALPKEMRRGRKDAEGNVKLKDYKEKEEPPCEHTKRRMNSMTGYGTEHETQGDGAAVTSRPDSPSRSDPTSETQSANRTPTAPSLKSQNRGKDSKTTSPPSRSEKDDKPAPVKGKQVILFNPRPKPESPLNATVMPKAKSTYTPKTSLGTNFETPTFPALPTLPPQLQYTPSIASESSSTPPQIASEAPPLNQTQLKNSRPFVPQNKQTKPKQTTRYYAPFSSTISSQNPQPENSPSDSPVNRSTTSDLAQALNQPLHTQTNAIPHSSSSSDQLDSVSSLPGPPEVFKYNQPKTKRVHFNPIHRPIVIDRHTHALPLLQDAMVQPLVSQRANLSFAKYTTDGKKGIANIPPSAPSPHSFADDVIHDVDSPYTSVSSYRYGEEHQSSFLPMSHQNVSPRATSYSLHQSHTNTHSDHVATGKTLPQSQSSLYFDDFAPANTQLSFLSEHSPSFEALSASPTPSHPAISLFSDDYRLDVSDQIITGISFTSSLTSSHLSPPTTFGRNGPQFMSPDVSASLAPPIQGLSSFLDGPTLDNYSEPRLSGHIGSSFDIPKTDYFSFAPHSQTQELAKGLFDLAPSQHSEQISPSPSPSTLDSSFLSSKSNPVYLSNNPLSNSLQDTTKPLRSSHDSSDKLTISHPSLHMQYHSPERSDGSMFSDFSNTLQQESSF